jgi:signal transduction histidine kinase
MSVRGVDERAVELGRVATDDAADAAGRTLESGRRDGSPARDWRVASARIAHGREMTVIVHDDEARATWARAGGDIAAIVGIGLLTAVVGAFVVSRQALRPLDDLARTSARIVRSGDLGLRVREDTAAGALGDIAVLINQMLARNDRLVRAMKSSLDDVAHDLRTPLTRLRAGAELALSHPEDNPPEEALADVIDESDRVLAMLATLMDIAEAETGVMRLVREPAPLAAVAREAVDLYELVAQERGVHVVTKLTEPAVANIDRRRMLQVIANLVDNAVKYTPPSGRVMVETLVDGEAVVAVSDTGIGIAPEDQPRVWDRLFRADRSRAERGLGLGLSLVRAVVEAHGGRVTLTSAPDEGTRVEVRLPVATPA